MEELSFIQIATGTYDNNGTMDFVLYGLTHEGKLFYFSMDSGSWVLMNMRKRD